jgi:hypothetical protein
MSVLKDWQGPDWPLGNIVVTSPGTPVSIMSLVDSGGVNDPSAATSSTSQEYSPTFYSLTIQAMKLGAGSHGLTNNVGNIYLVRKSGSRDDLGTILACITPGVMYTLLITPGASRGFSPYRYYLDADNANDAGQCVGFIA